jgi:hypothetical protein
MNFALQQTKYNIEMSISELILSVEEQNSCNESIDLEF